MATAPPPEERNKEALKKTMLDLLEEDREFRYALMGLLGFREVLDRISRIEERQQKLEERFARLEERVVKLEKRFAYLEERLLEVEKTLVDVLDKLTSLYEAFETQRRKLELLTLEVGALIESMYSRFVFEDIKSELEARGEKIASKTRSYRINGEEVDLLVVAEKEVYVVEVEVKPKHSDVGALLVKADLIAEKHPDEKVKPVLAGAMIGREVEDYATQRGVRIYKY